ncbi:hypothetical protein NPIL_273401, partial [Nephila pilipes]
DFNYPMYVITLGYGWRWRAKKGSAYLRVDYFRAVRWGRALWLIKRREGCQKEWERTFAHGSLSKNKRGVRKKKGLPPILRSSEVLWFSPSGGLIFLRVVY